MKTKIWLCFSLLLSLLITGCTTSEGILQTAISKNPELAKAISTQISSDISSGTTQPKKNQASVTPLPSYTPTITNTPTITEEPVPLVELYSVYIPFVIYQHDE